MRALIAKGVASGVELAVAAIARADTVDGIGYVALMTRTTRIAALLVVLSSRLFACTSEKTPGEPSGSQGGGDGGGGGTTSESARRGTVTLSKGGASVVEYTSTGVEGTIDADQIYFELNSPDTNQVLHLTIHALTPGSYDIVDLGTPNKAHILFFSEDKLPDATPDEPGEWTPNAGKLTLDEATNAHAKGSFTATGTPLGAADSYTIAGTFDIPLRPVD